MGDSCVVPCRVIVGCVGVEVDSYRRVCVNSLKCGRRKDFPDSYFRGDHVILVSDGLGVRLCAFDEEGEVPACLRDFTVGDGTLVLGKIYSCSYVSLYMDFCRACMLRLSQVCGDYFREHVSYWEGQEFRWYLDGGSHEGVFRD